MSDPHSVWPSIPAVYAALQNRLDNYRSAAIAVAGGAIALMAVLYSPLVGGAASSLAQSQKVVMVVLTLAVGVVAWLILRRIQSNFREMSRIIVRIDRRYGMSDQTFDEFGPLFPCRWTQKKSLARRGWSDFIIDSLKGTIVVTTILNCFLVAFVVFQQEIMEYLARNHSDVYDFLEPYL